MKLVPGYDLARHLIEGTPAPRIMGPQPQANPVDFANPMDFVPPGDVDAGAPNDANVYRLDNSNVVSGLDTGDSKRAAEGEQVDMTVASNCEDEPTKGGLAYGPRYTGGH